MCQTRWRFDDNDDKADIVQCVKTAHMDLKLARKDLELSMSMKT